MCRSMVDIHSATAEIRRGKKRKIEEGNHMVKYNGLPYYRAAIKKKELECGPMLNVMAALPNIGGVLCSTPQSLTDAHFILECRAVTLPRRETRSNLLRCPKLANGSQPLVGRSSPYCKAIWRTYCCLTSFFCLSIRALVTQI